MGEKKIHFLFVSEDKMNNKKRLLKKETYNILYTECNLRLQLWPHLALSNNI
jgi:hypothetical protein